MKKNELEIEKYFIDYLVKTIKGVIYEIWLPGNLASNAVPNEREF